MYIVRIKTKYNLITLKVEDTTSEEFKELVNQPYVEEVYIETIEHFKNGLIEERNNLLNHIVGMDYNTRKALELNEKIKEL